MKVFSSDKGFTLLETIVAIWILAVGTLGVASMLMIHFTSDGYAARTRRAESVGTQKLERQLDVTVGWPVGGLCTSSTPESCKNRCAVTTFFKPLKY